MGFFSCRKGKMARHIHPLFSSHQSRNELRRSNHLASRDSSSAWI